jgi:hypothetical protein
MGAAAEFMSVREFSEATGWPAPTVRWHCRHARGMLHKEVTRLQIGPEKATTVYLIPRAMVGPLTAARREYVAWRRMAAHVAAALDTVDGAS